MALSPAEGTLLDSESRILTYLNVHLSFLDNMAVLGFDGTLGKDDLRVAVSRDGRLIKVNRDLHPLAMAQRVGLDSVAVMVKAVHRECWQEVTAGTTGRAALQRVTEALTTCKPETAPEELDPAGGQESGNASR